MLASSLFPWLGTHSLRLLPPALYWVMPTSVHALVLKPCAELLLRTVRSWIAGGAPAEPAWHASLLMGQEGKTIRVPPELLVLALRVGPGMVQARFLSCPTCQSATRLVAVRSHLFQQARKKVSKKDW